jgi:hypothetical protein
MPAATHLPKQLSMANQHWFVDISSSVRKFTPQAPTRSPNWWRQFTSAAACIKGITLCITPLLYLGADQVQKIMSKTSETDKSIVGFHLDELTDAKLVELRMYMSTLTSNTNKTVTGARTLV